MEYEPSSQQEAQREYAEPSPAKAVVGAQNRGNAPDSGRMQFGYRMSEAEQGRGEADEDDNAAGESYFAREMQELQELPPNGESGPRPMYRFRTGATYNGQWKGNARHGVGVQTWRDGASFTGKWVNSFADGIGKFVHADGDVFVGQWKTNAAQGLGTYHHRKGQTTYRGEWIEDLQHGVGVETWDGGSSYSGQFVYGKKEGYGVYTWPDGSIYQGTWEGNSINGKGHYIGKDGRQFRGEWKGAVIHGIGEYTWPDGRSFCGQYCNDQKEGFGVFTWRDQRRFEGFWLQGKQHGRGCTYKASGDVIKKGVWIMGAAPENPEDVPEGNNVIDNQK